MKQRGQLIPFGDSCRNTTSARKKASYDRMEQGLSLRAASDPERNEKKKKKKGPRIKGTPLS